MMYRDEHFSLSLSYKRKEADGFAADKSLGHAIEKMAGSGEADDPCVFRIEIRNRNTTAWTGVVKTALSGGRPDARFFLPGYLYGKNNDRSTLQPGLVKEFQRLKKGPVSIPFSPYWYMRADQLTHPVAVMFADGRILGISGGPFLTRADPPAFWEGGPSGGFAGFNGFFCSVENDAEIGFTAGYLNYPGVYTSPWEYTGYGADQQGCVSIPAGGSARIAVRVFSFASAREDGLGRVLEGVYDVYRQKPRKHRRGGARETAAALCRAISRDAYDPWHNNYSLIMMTPVSADRPHVYEPKRRFAAGDYRGICEGLIGWTNGAVIAGPLLQASYRLGDPSLRVQGVKVIDGIVARSLNPATGIPFCARIEGEWTNAGWWSPWIASEGVKPGHSSYIVGQTLYYILKAYELEKSRGRTRGVWLEFVGRVVDTFAKTQDRDGAFPRFWDERTGAGSEYDAFAGCWAAAALAKYAALASRRDLLPAAQKAEARYFADVARMECAKTPLDVADSPDAEGVLAYIRLARLLCGLVGERDAGISYLERMRTGLDYALSFVYCYNVPSLPPPLGPLRWSSSGGSVTSVCNAVIHCMLNTIADELLYYCKKTGSRYYASRLKDIYDWGLQVYNRRDCEFSFGGKGWSSEYFCQAGRYVIDVRLPDGSRSSLWFAYHPWATASVLEGICGDMWRE